MFERFNTPGLYLGNTGVLAMYAASITTGIVVESDDGVINITAVHEGIAVHEGVRRVELMFERFNTPGLYLGICFISLML